MFMILDKKELAPNTFWFEVRAPLVCHSRKPGQFMIICPSEKGERIPISLAGSNYENDSIWFVVQAIGRTTREICSREIGDSLYAIVGPLGQPSPIRQYGTVVCMGGGYGVAALLPIAAELKRVGNRVIGVIGARTRDLILLEDRMREACDEVRLSTNDGSAGTTGFVTHVLQELVEEGITVDHTFAIGPVPMMAAVSNMTGKMGIGCTVSLNALMVDGTGMCGGCRVSVNGESKFACYDGPDFEGHEVDFDELMNRQKWYVNLEQQALHLNGKNGSNGKAAEQTEHSPLCPYHSPFPDELEKEWVANIPEGVDLSDPNRLKPKERMAIPRQPMPEQAAEIRSRNFEEVALGYTPKQAEVEASRCLDCGKPACVEGCPVGVDIPRFMKLVREEKFLEAAGVIKETNVLPAVCGRVCPQENQCEKQCIVGKKHEPVAIGRLERFVADYERLNGNGNGWKMPQPSGKKVAIVGSGPASLTVAGDLIQKGHEVHVFEALHRLGGVLVYGIPEFRLPNEIVDQEIEALRRQGVKFYTNVLVGRSKTVDEFFEREGFDAVFLGTGAGLPRMMNIPGENLKGVYTANEFLTRINLMRADRFPEYGTPVTVGKRVAVIGCGNTAMDAARVSVRMGAEEVTVVYRRTLAEAPARKEEIEHAMQEGVQFRFLTAPVQLSGSEEQWVTEMECIQMELGEPDASGRRRPVEKKGSEFRIAVDTIVTALGFGVNPLVPSTTEGLKLDKWGVVIADRETGKTSRPGVFAGGDVITGGSTVIMAMGQGRVAARAIHDYLESGEF
ncbi:MAG: NADPH-dependent glutamate synthase [bacterium]|jgi:glutamate synthase (NADPH/NADH) small chain